MEGLIVKPIALPGPGEEREDGDPWQKRRNSNE
jgi:hypothetical protein